jgi:NAD(P)-dependent dehydrogenase (short-subunit alcohol dehydrogenase family)
MGGVLELTGTTAVVTGGASGIGAAVAAALQSHGVAVASLDLTDDGPAKVRIACDVSDESSLDDAMARAVGELGGLHYAFVNAGIAGMGSVLSMPSAEWDRVVNVNLRGAFLTLQRAARHIKDTGEGGAIVATASSAGILADVGIVHYSVAKMGLRQLVRVAARELGPYGIRVNAVAPGVTRTPMTAATDQLPGYHEQLVRNTPLGRLGEPTDIVEAVLALFALRWVTGQTLAADGGVTLAAGTDIPGFDANTAAAWFDAAHRDGEPTTDPSHEPREQP